MRSRHDLVDHRGRRQSGRDQPARARHRQHVHGARSEAPVLLAGDIDRGGVFAAFVGTLALLEPEDRAPVQAFWVNKFRGDLSLLHAGLDWLTSTPANPSLGVLPHLGRLRIAEEDSLNVDARASPPSGPASISSSLRAPLAAHLEPRRFQPFEHEPDVTLSFSEDPERARRRPVDRARYQEHRERSRLAARTRTRPRDLPACALRRPVLGICGGCQLLGRHILDPHAVESTEARSEGLGLLALSTEFQREKRTRRVNAQPLGRGVLFAGAEHLRVPGYFIHAGVARAEGPDLFGLEAEGLRGHDGTVDESGTVMGTMIHGLFEHDALRHHAIDQLRRLRGLSTVTERARWDRHADYDRLADAIAQHCDNAWLNRLVAI